MKRKAFNEEEPSPVKKPGGGGSAAAALRAQQRTEGERQLHARWAGCGVKVEIVRTVADVYRVLGLGGYREESTRATEW